MYYFTTEVKLRITNQITKLSRGGTFTTPVSYPFYFGSVVCCERTIKPSRLSIARDNASAPSWGAEANAVYSGTDIVPLASQTAMLELGGGLTGRINANISVFANVDYEFAVGAELDRETPAI
jgi:hypothetical protein